MLKTEKSEMLFFGGAMLAMASIVAVCVLTGFGVPIGALDFLHVPAGIGIGSAFTGLCCLMWRESRAMRRR